MTKEKISHPNQLLEWKSDILDNRPPYKKTVVVSSGTCGQASGSLSVIQALEKELEEKKLNNIVEVKITGCHGFCEMEPNLIIYPDEIFYKKLTDKDIPRIVEESLVNDKKIDSLVFEEAKTKEKFHEQPEIPFYKKQMRLLTESNFKINPTLIDDYVALDGYLALSKVLFNMTSEEVMQKETTFFDTPAEVSKMKKSYSPSSSENDLIR